MALATKQIPARLEASAPDVLNLTQPFPAGYACIGNFGTNCNISGNGLATLPGAFPINVTSIPTQTKYSYSQQWSLSVQRELPRSFVATFAYVGSKGTHLTVERQINQLEPISPALNPFALHEPFLLAVPGASVADCTNLGSITKPVFLLQNGTTVTSNNPASVNLQAACEGQSAQAAIAVANSLRPYPGLGEIFSLQNVSRFLLPRVPDYNSANQRALDSRGGVLLQPLNRRLFRPH